MMTLQQSGQVGWHFSEPVLVSVSCAAPADATEPTGSVRERRRLPAVLGGQGVPGGGMRGQAHLQVRRNARGLVNGDSALRPRCTNAGVTPTAPTGPPTCATTCLPILRRGNDRT